MSERDSRGRFTKPTARAFQVGARVRGLSAQGRTVTGSVVEVEPIDYSGDLPVRVQSASGDEAWLYRGTIHLLGPSPQPEADELLAAARCEAGIGPDDDLVNWIKGVFERLADAGEYIAALANAKEALKRREKHERTRADAAEAKLADARAIMRTFKIMETLKDDAGFSEAMELVLEGKAS